MITRSRRPLIPLLILLLAAALQMGSLTSYARFHPDEAFFMTFARNAAVQGDGWLHGSLDKPPLSIYINAAALTFFALTTDQNGVLQLDVYRGEFAARITGVWMALLWISVLMRLVWTLYRDHHVARFVGILAAGSPLVIAFGPTAFMDIPMLLFASLALWAAAENWPVWSGTAFILAFASKPQAIYFAPLIIAIFIVNEFASTREKHAKPLQRVLLRWIFPIVLGSAVLWAWDVGRGETSIFVMGAANNLPTGSFLVAGIEWQERFWEWLNQTQYLVGDASFVMLAVISFYLVMSLLGQALEAQRNQWDVMMLVWALSYSIFHIVTRQNMYDRYLLFLVIPLGVLAARSLTYMRRWNVEGRLLPVFGAIALLAALGAYQAATGNTIIGGDRGTYTEIDTLANYLNDWPVATVIYDRWLGWELGYYIGPWSNKRRVYYPTPQALSDGATALPECGTRLFVAPLDKDVESWLQPLRETGFQVNIDRKIGGFQVYTVIPACGA